MKVERKPPPAHRLAPLFERAPSHPPFTRIPFSTYKPKTCIAFEPATLPLLLLPTNSLSHPPRREFPQFSFDWNEADTQKTPSQNGRTLVPIRARRLNLQRSSNALHLLFLRFDLTHSSSPKTTLTTQSTLVRYVVPLDIHLTLIPRKSSSTSFLPFLCIHRDIAQCWLRLVRKIRDFDSHTCDIEHPHPTHDRIWRRLILSTLRIVEQP